jgi:hypothetical protein
LICLFFSIKLGSERDGLNASSTTSKLARFFLGVVLRISYSTPCFKLSTNKKLLSVNNLSYIIPMAELFGGAIGPVTLNESSSQITQEEGRKVRKK